MMTHAMEVLYKNDKCFHNRLKMLENTTAVLMKVTFNDLQALQTSYDKDLDILDTISITF